MFACCRLQTIQCILGQLDTVVYKCERRRKTEHLFQLRPQRFQFRGSRRNRLLASVILCHKGGHVVSQKCLRNHCGCRCSRRFGCRCSRRFGCRCSRRFGCGYVVSRIVRWIRNCCIVTHRRILCHPIQCRPYFVLEIFHFAKVHQFEKLFVSQRVTSFKNALHRQFILQHSLRQRQIVLLFAFFLMISPQGRVLHCYDRPVISSQSNFIVFHINENQYALHRRFVLRPKFCLVLKSILFLHAFVSFMHDRFPLRALPYHFHCVTNVIHLKDRTSLRL